jgi:YhcH/YjgK/YiaL family protein
MILSESYYSSYYGSKSIYFDSYNEPSFPAASETDIVLTAGMYAVLFPGEIHRPQCNYKGETTVRKVVVKVAKELLM